MTPTWCAGSTNWPMRNTAWSVRTLTNRYRTMTTPVCAEIEIALDQCWDLLRQRRARREFGEDPDAAAVRPRRRRRELPAVT